MFNVKKISFRSNRSILNKSKYRQFCVFLQRAYQYHYEHYSSIRKVATFFASETIHC
jgi:hypothetical protein